MQKLENNNFDTWLSLEIDSEKRSAKDIPATQQSILESKHKDNSIQHDSGEDNIYTGHTKLIKFKKDNFEEVTSEAMKDIEELILFWYKSHTNCPLTDKKSSSSSQSGSSKSSHSSSSGSSSSRSSQVSLSQSIQWNMCCHF
jgi:hypothetical protein